MGEGPPAAQHTPKAISNCCIATGISGKATATETAAPFLEEGVDKTAGASPHGRAQRTVNCPADHMRVAHGDDGDHLSPRHPVPSMGHDPMLHEAALLPQRSTNRCPYSPVVDPAGMPTTDPPAGVSGLQRNPLGSLPLSKASSFDASTVNGELGHIQQAQRASVMESTGPEPTHDNDDEPSMPVAIPLATTDLLDAGPDVPEESTAL
jgi:hypothetical protein